MTLFELNEKASLILRTIEEQEGDIEGLESEYSELFADVTDKLQAYAHVISRMEQEETFLTEKIKEFQARKKAIESNVERLKSNILTSMQLCGLDKVSDTYTITRAKSPVSVIVADINILPAWFVKAALQNGEVVSGASLSEESFYIKIK
jgi:predicted RNase H-like nuclease (RuvC/YqgF family)